MQGAETHVLKNKIAISFPASDYREVARESFRATKNLLAEVSAFLFTISLVTYRTPYGLAVAPLGKPKVAVRLIGPVP